MIVGEDERITFSNKPNHPSIFNSYFSSNPGNPSSENRAPFIRLFDGSMLKYLLVRKSALERLVLSKMVPIRSHSSKTEDSRSACEKSVSSSLQFEKRVFLIFNL